MMFMQLNLLSLLTFLAVACVIIGVYSLAADLYLRDKEKIRERLDDEFLQQQRTHIKGSVLFGDLSAAAAASGTPTPSLRQRLEELIEQSALEVTVKQLALGSLGAACVTALLLAIVRQGFLVALIGGLLASGLPFLYVELKRRARQAKILAQLPDAFDLMAQSLIAGQSVPQAMHAVAEGFQPPLAVEFSYCFEQQNLGLSAAVALRDLARRSGLLELKIFAMSLVVQQETGGNLAGLLAKLANVVRERSRVRGKMKSLTAEGRLQALVLLALPPLMLVTLFLLDRPYIQLLLDQPKLIGLAALSMGAGMLWIRKIVDLDV
jgi:tight adherence protein B